MKRRGFTLSETMISMAIYAVFLTIICQMYTSTYAALRTYDQPMQQRQLAYATFNHLCTVIRNTPAVIDPPYATMLAGVYASPPIAYSGLVVRDPGGYRLNGSRLEELAYATDYDPSTPSTTVPLEPARLLCSTVSLFEICLYSPDQASLVRLRLQQTPAAPQQGGPISLDTLVNFREAQ